MEETLLNLLAEEKYSEKIVANGKDIDIEWKGTKKITDYFKMEIKADFKILGLKEVEVSKGETKFKSNQGQVKLKVKGILVRDYQAKFEGTGFRKFLRETYEKWVIPSRVDEMEDKIIGWCDEFLNQAKAYLDLEGRK
jgi:hypothetical protein